MIILGIETSCDETGVAVYETGRGLLSQRLHSQVALHAEYGGVVPELASRDHVRRLLPLVELALSDAGLARGNLDAIAYTAGPGLSGALLVGASVAQGMALALRIPALGVHHLEGHLLSPLLADPAPEFPFIALLVSGGHTQLMQVAAAGRYLLLGETVDDAAGEAFDKSAQLLGLDYPGGPALARLAESGDPAAFRLPRPMIGSGDLNFSFSGLKTAVRLLVEQQRGDTSRHADIAASAQEAIVAVLVEKSLAALAMAGAQRLVVAGGVGANRRLRTELTKRAATAGVQVFYPPVDLCTDNGAMIAFAGALRLERGEGRTGPQPFTVRPRWDLEELGAAGPLAPA